MFSGNCIQKTGWTGPGLVPAAFHDMTFQLLWDGLCVTYIRMPFPLSSLGVICNQVLGDYINWTLRKSRERLKHGSAGTYTPLANIVQSMPSACLSLIIAALGKGSHRFN